MVARTARRSHGDREPLWSRLFGTGIALLVINLFWNEPLAQVTGGGLVPFVLFNLAPSAAAIFMLLGVKPRRT